MSRWFRPCLLRLLLAGCALAAACDRPPERAAGKASPEARPEARRFWEVHDRARDLYAGGDLQRAEEAYTEALRLRPDHAASLYNLANIQFRLRHHDGALARLEALQRLEPRETKALLLEAAVLADPRPLAPYDPERALAVLERALERNPEETGPFLLQGRTALLAGDGEKAAERLEVVIRSDPLAAEAWNLLGVLALRGGDREGAAARFRRAEKAALGAPPPAGLPGEGDTSGGGAGQHRLQLLQARWLLSLMERTGGGGSPAGAPAAAAFRELEALGLPPRALPGAKPRCGRALAAGDFDGDGIEDLAAGSLTGAVEIYRLRGGAFEPAATVEVRGVSFLAAGDLDGDSRSDLYALRGGDLVAGEPLILLSRGDFRFEEAAVPGGRRFALAAAVVRAGDGAEVVEVGRSRDPQGAVRIVKRRGEAWALESAPGAPADDCALDLAVLPPEPGGREAPDIAVAFARSPPLLFRRAAGAWSAAAGVSGLKELGAVERLAAVDLDGDGRSDLAAGASIPFPARLEWLVEGRGGRSPIRLLRRAGRDRFEPPELELPAFASSLTALAAADLDGDGAGDLLAFGGGPEPWHLEPGWALLRRGGGFVLRLLEYPPGTFSASAALVLAGRGGSERRLAAAGGGLMPLDPGAVFILDLPPPGRARPLDR